jgi:kynurenine formamidase
MGMPTWVAAGDPSYQIWMSHMSPGTVIDNLTGQTPEINEQIGYSGDAFSTYSHCGTHIDNLNNLESGGQIWNHFTASEHFGSRHWTKCGADKWPPGRCLTKVA